MTNCHPGNLSRANLGSAPILLSWTPVIYLQISPLLCKILYFLYKLSFLISFKVVSTSCSGAIYIFMVFTFNVLCVIVLVSSGRVSIIRFLSFSIILTYFCKPSIPNLIYFVSCFCDTVLCITVA